MWLELLHVNSGQACLYSRAVSFQQLLTFLAAADKMQNDKMMRFLHHNSPQGEHQCHW